jgi:hypothetical protein
MSIEKIRERAAELRNRDQARKMGLRTQVSNERLAGAHAEHLGRMRAAGDFHCNHAAVGAENGKTLLVFCDQCDPQQ